MKVTDINSINKDTIIKMILTLRQLNKKDDEYWETWKSLLMKTHKEVLDEFNEDLSNTALRKIEEEIQVTHETI